MTYPFVKRLRYKMESYNNIVYKDDCDPIYYETEIYKVSLENKILVCDFKVYYSSIEDAREEIEKLLRSWEIDAGLIHGAGALKFKFLDADIIDRDITDRDVNEENILDGDILDKKVINKRSITVNASVTLNASVSIRVIKGKYPDVPVSFQTNPYVEIAWMRYVKYLEGKEPLLSMAYFIYSLLQGLSGGTHYIREKYKISKKVIDKLAVLISERGDYYTARKGKKLKFIPLQNDEIQWIEACIKMIIRRLGEYEKNPNDLVFITMDSLPKLGEKH